MSDIPSSQSDYKFVTFSKANPLMKDFVFTGDVSLPKPGYKLRIEPIAFINECAEARLMLDNGSVYVTNMDGRITGPERLVRLHEILNRDVLRYGRYGTLKSTSLTEGFELELTSYSPNYAEDEVKGRIFTPISKDTVDSLKNEVISKFGYGLPIDSSAFGTYLVNALKESECYFEDDTSESGNYLVEQTVDGESNSYQTHIATGTIYNRETDLLNTGDVRLYEQKKTGKISVDIGLVNLVEVNSDDEVLMSCGAMAMCWVENYIQKANYKEGYGWEFTDILDKKKWIAVPLFDNVDIKSKIIETEVDLKDVADTALSIFNGTTPEQNTNALGHLEVYLSGFVSWRRLKYTGNIDEIL